MRHVAGLRERPVVRLRRHLDDRHPQRLPELSPTRAILRVEADGGGVTTHTRSTNNSASACAQPCFSEPAIGCEPINVTPAGKSSSDRQMGCFTLPASVIKVPGRAALASARTSSDNAIDGCANDDEVASRGRLGRFGLDPVDQFSSQGRLEILSRPPAADDLTVKSAALQRGGQRTANHPAADDTDRLKRQRFGVRMGHGARILVERRRICDHPSA